MSAVAGGKGADDVAQGREAEIDARRLFEPVAGRAGATLPLRARQVDEVQPAPAHRAALRCFGPNGDRLQGYRQDRVAARARRVHLRGGGGSPAVALLHQPPALPGVLDGNLAQPTCYIGPAHRVLLRVQRRSLSRYLAVGSHI